MWYTNRPCMSQTLYVYNCPLVTESTHSYTHSTPRGAYDHVAEAQELEDNRTTRFNLIHPWREEIQV